MPAATAVPSIGDGHEDGPGEGEGAALPPHLERLDKLLTEPPHGAVRLLMEELAAASRTPELAGVLRGFAALGACLESPDCDLEDGILSEISRLAELREQRELSERLDALRRLGASLGTPEHVDGSEDLLEEVARFALAENPEAASRFKNLAILDSLLGSGGGEAEILRGVASFLRSGAGSAKRATETDAFGHEASAAEPVSVEASPPEYRIAARLEVLADLGDLMYSDAGEGEILRGVAAFREEARARATFHDSDNLQIGAGPIGDPIAIRLSELADFNRLLRSGARGDEMLDEVVSLLAADQQAVPRLARLAELSRILDNTPATDGLSSAAASDAARVADSLEGLARLLQATSPGSAERVRSLAVVSAAVEGASDSVESRALTALADLFSAVPARTRLLALANLGEALGSQHPAAAVAILRQSSDLAARDNSASASILSSLSGVAESITYPSAEAVPAALGSVASLFDQENPETGATVRSLGVIGSVVHSSSNKAVARSLHRAHRDLRKKSPEASTAFGQLAQLSQAKVAQAQAGGIEKNGSRGGLLRALLLTGAAVVVGEENAAVGDVLARVASGESVKASALQGAIDIAGQGDLDAIIGDTGASIVAGLSEGLLTGTPPPQETASGTSPASGEIPPGNPIAILAPGSIRFTNASHEWIDRRDTGWTFRWRVTVTNTTNEVLNIAILCNLDTGPGSQAALASDVVNVHLKAGQVLDVPHRTFRVDPAIAEQATSVGILARLAS